MSLDKLELIQQKLPRFYKKYEMKSDSDKSVMYAVLNALAGSSESLELLLERIDNGIGIDTVEEQDLYNIFGSLLGITKSNDISYSLYRNELKLAIPSLVGGTSDAIAYAIAIVVGIEKDATLQANYIDVIDGWDYVGNIPDEFRKDGCFVCSIDLSIGDDAINREQDIINAVNSVKASGTAFYMVYKEFKILRYSDMDVFRYDTLDNITYDSLGVE